MNFVSYAQNFEDVMLWRALSDVTPGNYIDIGAQDPVVDSVSRAFYEAGWRGIHVEPTARYAAALRENRPDELVIEALVSSEAGLKTFYEVPDTGLSTGIAEIAECHHAAGLTTMSHTLPSISLASLLDKHNGKDIHWLKIDVEGMEADVLCSWGDHPARPWILVIESTFPNSQEPTHHAWIDKVTGRGYSEVYFDGLSRFFLAEGQEHRMKAFQAPPNIFDQFQIESHHFSSVLMKQKMDAAAEAARAEHDAKITTIEKNRDALQQAHRVELAHRDDEIATTQMRLAETHAELDSVGQTADRLTSLLGELHSSRGWRWTAPFRRLIEPRGSGDLAVRIRTALLFPAAGKEYHVEHSAPDGNLIDTSSSMPILHASTTSLPTENLESLLSLDGKDFIRGAYAIALRRTPDPEGEHHYLKQMNEGFSKIDVLVRLRKSREAQEIEATIVELDDILGINTTIKKILKPIKKAISRRSGSHNFHINYLMVYHDEEFVENAYRRILGRSPDNIGLNHYLSEVRSGTSRKEIIYKLAKSREARASNLKIIGMKRFAVFNRLTKIPLVGTIFLIILLFCRIKELLKSIRALQNHLYRISTRHG